METRMGAAMDIDLGAAEVLNVSRRGGGGHRVLKIEFRGEPVVLKLYGMKRGLLRTALRQFGSLAIVGKTSIASRSRRETERRLLELWRREGFDVPALRDPPPLAAAGRSGQPILAMEWIPGPTLAEVVHDAKVPLEHKRDLIAAFTGVWARRHARALELREPGLLFEHPTFEHVIVSDGRLVHFDFEIAFTRTRGLETLVGREIVGFLRSLFKEAGADFLRLLEVIVDRYPDQRLLEGVRDDLLTYGTVPVLGWMRRVPLRRLAARIFRGRKAHVRRSIAEALDRSLRRGAV